MKVRNRVHGLQVCEALHNHVKHVFPEDYARRAAAITAEEAQQGYGSFPVDDVEYSTKQVSFSCLPEDAEANMEACSPRGQAKDHEEGRRFMHHLVLHSDPLIISALPFRTWTLPLDTIVLL